MKYELTAKRLREAMDNAGMRQKDLAAASGVSKSNISHYMNGNHVPDNVMAMKLGKALGVKPDWLMGIDEAAEYTVIEKTPLIDLIQNMDDSKRDRLLEYARFLMQEVTNEKR